MSGNSVFDQTSSVFIGVKAVVGDIPHPILRRFCVRVRFFSIDLFLLVAHTEKHWRKLMAF